MYQQLGNLINAQRLGSFEGEASVAAHSGIAQKKKWTMDRKLRDTEQTVASLKAKQDALKAQLAVAIDSDHIADLKKRLDRIANVLRKVQGDRRTLVSDVAITDSGATSSFGGFDGKLYVLGAITIIALAIMVIKFKTKA